MFKLFVHYYFIGLFNVDNKRMPLKFCLQTIKYFQKLSQHNNTFRNFPQVNERLLQSIHNSSNIQWIHWSMIYYPEATSDCLNCLRLPRLLEWLQLCKEWSNICTRSQIGYEMLVLACIYHVKRFSNFLRCIIWSKQCLLIGLSV